MISVAEAKKIILENGLPKREKEIPLAEAFEKILAQDVAARCDVPLFDNSAMDGFAVFADDTRGASPHSLRALKIGGELRAGDAPRHPLKKGEAVRIMTGARVPPEATAVVMREQAREEGGQVLIEIEAAPGDHIRRRGEEIRAGDKALGKGTRLGPAALAFLASVGVSQVPVYLPPKVGLLVTGSELVPFGGKLKPGQIYETNSIALKAALAQSGVAEISVALAKDDKAALAAAAEKLLRRSDCLIVVGGVSVGDWDFSKEILDRCGVKTLFWKVAQKPGKPLYFGRTKDKTVFGLPGNPASALVCFYEYVRGHLCQAMGSARPLLPSVPATLRGEIRKKPGVAYFLRGTAVKKNSHLEVVPSPGQESYRLGSFAESNALIALPENGTEYFDADTVEVHLLP